VLTDNRQAGAPVAPLAYYDEILVDAAQVADTLKWGGRKRSIEKDHRHGESAVAKCVLRSRGRRCEWRDARLSRRTFRSHRSRELQSHARRRLGVRLDVADDRARCERQRGHDAGADVRPRRRPAHDRSCRAATRRRPRSSRCRPIATNIRAASTPRASARSPTPPAAMGAISSSACSRSAPPFAITAEHAEKPQKNVTKESIDIATQRGIAVEEIVRNHQAYKAYQESIQPRYIARDTTNLRFRHDRAGEAIERRSPAITSPQPKVISDWVWQDFYPQRREVEVRPQCRSCRSSSRRRSRQLPARYPPHERVPAINSCARPTSTAITRTKSASSRRRTRRSRLPLYPRHRLDRRTHVGPHPPLDGAAPSDRRGVVERRAGHLSAVPVAQALLPVCQRAADLRGSRQARAARHPLDAARGEGRTGHLRRRPRDAGSARHDVHRFPHRSAGVSIACTRRPVRSDSRMVRETDKGMR